MIQDIYSEITKVCATWGHTAVPLIKKAPWVTKPFQWKDDPNRNIVLCVYTFLKVYGDHQCKWKQDMTIDWIENQTC